MKKYKSIFIALILGFSVLPFITKAYTFQKNLNIGSKGAEVAALQNILIQDGYLTSKANGTFGKQTLTAVKKLQIANRLTTTSGIVDTITRNFLNQNSSTSTTSSNSQISATDLQQIQNTVTSMLTDSHSVVVFQDILNILSKYYTKAFIEKGSAKMNIYKNSSQAQQVIVGLYQKMPNPANIQYTSATITKGVVTIIYTDTNPQDVTAVTANGKQYATVKMYPTFNLIKENGQWKIDKATFFIK
jgi:peptidoglycan hydrolase-like protein with peptidoglycan-binding domain